MNPNTERPSMSGGDEELAAFGESEKGEGCISAAAFWQRFLRRIRILLVESDDSTRTIIAALLRKCGYRVVAASDGLEAWEVLKGSRSRNIDLVLTEVDLPSISGFALLTLITEHARCRRIPVVMMSTHDSMGVVYKCMRRGAADFLLKPVRRNELRDLWRHVWRTKQSSSAKLQWPAQPSFHENTQEANVVEVPHKQQQQQQGNANKTNTLRHSHHSAFSRWV